MKIATATIKLHASWVHSLKEKRMVVKSIITKVQNKFNVSIAEIAEMDAHQIIVIGLVCLSNSTSLSEKVVNEVVDFIEDNCDAEMIDVHTNVL